MKHLFKIVGITAMSLLLPLTLFAETLNFWFPGEGKTSDGYYIEAAKEFEQKTGINVKITLTPNPPKDIDTKLNAAKLSGQEPDVFMAYLIFMGTRGTRGYFAPLDEYIDKWEGKDDLFPSALKMGKVRGKYYGLGFQPAPEVGVYRKDFFAEAGLDPNKPPTSWEELAEYAEKLTKRDSNGKVIRAGLDIPTIEPAAVWMRPFLWQNGSQVVDQEKELPSTTDEGAIEALEYIGKLAKMNVHIPHSFTKRDQLPFIKGQSAMAFTIPHVVKLMWNNDPSMKDKVGFIPVMGRKIRQNFCGFRLWTILESSKKKESAWKFIEFLMEKDQFWKRYEAMKVPVALHSLEKRYIDDDPKLNAAIVEHVKFGRGQPVVPFAIAYNKHLRLAYEKVVAGTMDARSALMEADKNFARELPRYK